jgi:hypothetical protein
LSDNHKLIAGIWQYLFRLDINKKTSGEDSTFHKTNSPTIIPKAAGKKMKKLPLIEYKKKFIPATSRKNIPVKPGIPKLVDGFAKYSTGSQIKLVGYELRVWKKLGDPEKAKDSEIVLSKNDTDRKKAKPQGPTMASSLKKFSGYDGFTKNKPLKITTSSISATSLTKALLAKKADDTFKEDWKNFTGSEDLVTDQEWCHLLGYGDGGTNYYGNLVSGSNHCNTEQLAIEVGQRKVSQNSKLVEKNPKVKNIKAKITAYLVKNKGTYVKEVSEKTYKEIEKLADKCVLVNAEGVEIKLKDCFDKARAIKLPEIKAYFNALSKKISEVGKKDVKEKKTLFFLRHRIEKDMFTYWPVAKWMRYKLLIDNKKIFDHVFDAQSESMNVHECKILDHTVELLLYEALNLDYITYLSAHCLKQLPNENVLKKRIDFLNELRTFLIELKNSSDPGKMPLDKLREMSSGDKPSEAIFLNLETAVNEKTSPETISLESLKTYALFYQVNAALKAGDAPKRKGDHLKNNSPKKKPRK